MPDLSTSSDPPPRSTARLTDSKWKKTQHSTRFLFSKCIHRRRRSNLRFCPVTFWFSDLGLITRSAMTDPFSVSAGAVGVVSLGLTVSQGFMSFYGPWKSYDEEIQDFTGKLDGLQNILKILERLYSLRG
ncbi:hypothetical protein BJX65DRAFT_313472 [Aspergillus insuetus]